MNDRISLPIGYELMIKDVSSSFSVYISEIIGLGGNCIVYKGEHHALINGEKVDSSVIIKEFYPIGMNIIRLPNMSLRIQDQDLFEIMKTHFSESQSEHVHFYEYYQDQSLPRIFFYGEANNTVYAISDPGKGKTLSQINFEMLSLNRIASIMESICLAIRKIHVKEKLYLDCKPDNFFYYGNNIDLQFKVYLFDFDTIVSVKNIQNGKYHFCSASFGWAPPEQTLVVDSITGARNYSEPWHIGYHTDIYSIGAIFFWLLTKRKPEPSDIDKVQRRTFDWERESRFCHGAEIEIIHVIQDIAESTLQPDAEIRQKTFRYYISINAVKEKYEKLYGLTVGDNMHFEPIHHEIKELKKSLEEILSRNDDKPRHGAKNIPQSNGTINLSLKHAEISHYKKIYSKELETSSIEMVSEKIAKRILNGEGFRLELDVQILSIINKIIYNRKEYNVECQDGMVKVPKGSFIMGGASRTRDNPIRVEYIPYDYWIDSKPVTIAQYRKFLEEAGEINSYGHPLEPKLKSHYPTPDINYGITGPKLYVDYFTDPEYDNYPVTFIDWWDAYAYAQWAGKDLPLEIEWEKAARGIDGRIYPFGNEYNSKFCNTDESQVGKLTEVDAYPQGLSPYGCFDMSGNIWEWCADDYDENQTNRLKVVKGGSFRRGQNKAMTFSCIPRGPLERWITRGFRCVRRINENE